MEYVTVCLFCYLILTFGTIQCWWYIALCEHVYARARALKSRYFTHISFHSQICWWMGARNVHHVLASRCVCASKQAQIKSLTIAFTNKIHQLYMLSRVSYCFIHFSCFRWNFFPPIRTFISESIVTWCYNGNLPENLSINIPDRNNNKLPLKCLSPAKRTNPFQNG